MPLPVDLTTITVTGAYPGGDGGPLTGKVTFTPSTDLVDTTGHVIVRAAPITAPLYAGGFSIVLLCTDSAGISPTGWYWIVTEKIDGAADRVYNVLIPHSGASVDLSTLAPVTPGAPVSTLYGVLAAGNTNAWASNQVFNGTVKIPAGAAAGDVLTSDVAGNAAWQAPPGVPLDTNAAHFQPDGVAGAGATGLAADAGHAHPLPPWVFPITKYGAKGDLQCVNDGSMTSGSGTLTSPSAPFLPAHNGQTFVVKGALANGNALIATGTYVSSTQMTLSVLATATVSGLQTVWGSDNTSAIQQAIDAAMAYSNPFGLAAEVFTPPTSAGYGYMIAGPLKSTDGVNAVFNSQLTIKPYSDRAAKKRLAFSGAGDAGDCRHWNQDFPAFGGSTWFSACLPFATLAQQQTGANGVSTLGNPSVLGGPTGKAGYGITGTNPLFSNVTVAMHDMTIMNSHSVNGFTICPFNFHGMAGAHLDRCTYGTSGVVQYYTGAGGSGGNTDFAAVASLSGGISIGGLMPAAGNNASNRIMDCVWNGGFTYGPLITEHTTGRGNTVLYCWSGYCPVGLYGDGGTGAGALHGSDMGQMCVEGCAYQVNVFGAAAGGKGPYVTVTLDTEGTRQLRDNPSNGTSLAALRGVIRFRGSSGVPVWTFPTACKVILEENTPGVAASPPALSLTAPTLNSLYRDATLYLSGGTTVTTVQVSSLFGGTAAAPPALTTVADFTLGGTIPVGTAIRVPAGAWVRVNCAGLPAAIWVLD